MTTLRFEIAGARTAGIGEPPEMVIDRECAERNVRLADMTFIEAANCVLFKFEGEPSKPWPPYIVRPHVHALRARLDDWHPMFMFPQDGHTVEVQGFDGREARALWNTKAGRIELEPGCGLAAHQLVQWREIPQDTAA
jgi:hypothetical protein